MELKVDWNDFTKQLSIKTLNLAFSMKYLDQAWTHESQTNLQGYQSNGPVRNK